MMFMFVMILIFMLVFVVLHCYLVFDVI
jgi:hypothetical protein